MALRRVVSISLLVVAVEGSAFAGPVGGFLDLSAGVTGPEGDERYDALADGGPLLGVHLGPELTLHRADPSGVAGVVLGLDLGADHAWMNTANDDDPTKLRRWRFTAGPRLALRSGTGELFVRAGVGIDRLQMDATDLLEALCGDPVVTSAAYDGGVGASIVLGHVVVGAQAGVAVSDHAGDRPACAPIFGSEVHVSVLDTHDVDVDARLFIGARL